MPTRCILAGCSNTTKEGVSLHNFPNDENMRKVWTSRVKLSRKKWDGPSKRSVICSDHFNDSDFEDEGFWSQFGMKKSKRLKPNAIPKIKITLEGRKTESEPVEKQKKKGRPGAQKREVEKVSR